MSANKENKLEITELFLAKAEWNRTFIGTIERYTNEDGSELVVGKIPVHQYTILANAIDDRELGRKLDEMVVLILDYGINLIINTTWYNDKQGLNKN